MPGHSLIIDEQHEILDIIPIQVRETAISAFLAEPCAETFRCIPKKEQTEELVSLAIEWDGECLKYVSNQFVTEELCLRAVESNPYAVLYVPDKYLTKELFDKAIRSDPEVFCYAWAAYLPFMTEEDALFIAGQKDGPSEGNPFVCYIPSRLLTRNVIRKAIKTNPFVIFRISKKLIEDEDYIEAIRQEGYSLRRIPRNIKTTAFITRAIQANPLCIRWEESKYIGQALYLQAYAMDRRTIEWIPKKYITEEMYTEAVAEGILPIGDVPAEIINKKSFVDALIEKASVLFLLNEYGRLEKGQKSNKKSPLNKTILRYIYSKAERANDVRDYLYQRLLLGFHARLSLIEEGQLEKEIVTTCTKKGGVSDALTDGSDTAVVHYIEEDTSACQPVYYISDLHLESQLLPKTDKPGFSFEGAIQKKIQKLLDGIDPDRAILLIGGDVAHSKDLVKVFYKELQSQWNALYRDDHTSPFNASESKIIAVLGNHELWNGTGLPAGVAARSADDLIRQYRETFSRTDVLFLENALLLRYHNERDRLLQEEEILALEDDELKAQCNESSLVVLGGIGFSGNNPLYNASTGLYGKTVVSLEEDQERSERFEALHEKLKRCAYDKRVIVLTHMPVENWTSQVKSI